ncbi:MAG: DUF1501 domain-containing protein [Verrucomicrobia bacterium]|nr:DUF1501 domain-containing protein [Verrucomicrobiota bacterium]
MNDALTRRTFLQWAGATALAAGLAPAFARPAAPGRRILVVIHLQGGNDGFNTVVPLDSATYRRSRPTLALRAAEVLRLDDRSGLHPACRGLHGLYRSGRLAIVHGVGAAGAQPTNHFAAEESWETAGTGAGWLSGFIGRPPALASADATIAACYANGPAPQAFGPAPASRIASLAATAEQAGIEPAGEPGTLAAGLRLAARLIAAGHPARVYWLRSGGFDTHTDQLRRQAAALAHWSEALAAFHHELDAVGGAAEVTTLSYSEFGRTLAENPAGGTDHGPNGPVFLTGAGIAGGRHGTPPELATEPPAPAIPLPQFYSTLLADRPPPVPFGTPGHPLVSGSRKPDPTPWLICS